MSQILAVVTRYVVIDKAWDVQQAAAQVGRLAGSDLSFRTIPTGRPDLQTPADGVAVQVDPEAVRAFVTDQFSRTTADSSATSTPTATATPTSLPPAAIGPAASPTPTRVITAGGVPCVN